MDIRFAASAGKHGIDERRVLDVIERGLPPLGEEGRPDVLVFLGFDRHGVPLEVAAVELPDGGLLVVHAMRLRKRYRSALAEVMRWL